MRIAAIGCNITADRPSQITRYRVAPSQQQKIYLDREYPCPCRCQGKLQQIVLTDAFGCNCCRRIFVLQADSLTVEELAATYPYKRRYYWSGKRMQSLRSLPTGNFWVTVSSRESCALWWQCLVIIALVLVLFQLYCRVTLTSPILNLVLSIAIAIVVLVVITLWLFDQG